jgi:hypothetical protein
MQIKYHLGELKIEAREKSGDKQLMRLIRRLKPEGRQRAVVGRS